MATTQIHPNGVTAIYLGAEEREAWERERRRPEITETIYSNPKHQDAVLVGTELKKLLKRIGINPKGNCACNQRATVMDREGPEWCEEHIEEIVNWMQREAKKRKLPFIRAAGKLLVRRAIKTARRKQPNLQT